MKELDKKPDARTLKLNSREEAFCQAMTLIGSETLNRQSKSALAAGYSPTRAGCQGSLLYAKPKIKRRITALLAENLAKQGVTAESIIIDLVRLQALAETDGKLSDAIRATELLGRSKGLFSDRLTIDTTEMAEFSSRKKAELRKLAKLSLLENIDYSNEDAETSNA